MIKRRYTIVFGLLRPLFRIYLRIVYAFRGFPAPRLAKGEAALILSNHNGAFDPFFLATSFKRPIFFVASDHIFRLGWVSKLIRFLVNPIPIVKSQLDLRSLRQIRETIRDGGLVGLFPEGNRSFNGLTTRIPPSTGKLVKQLNCSLILYRLDGGYLTTPRWSRYKRKGFFQGKVTTYLKADELASMSPTDVYEVILKDLHVDAFAHQREKCVPYRGKKLAESLELTLFVCPQCSGLATLHSHGDLFSCQTCGLSVRYTVYGFFEPVDDWSKQQQEAGLFLDSVLSWDQWQRKKLPECLFEKKALDETGEKPLYQDANQLLVLTERAAHSNVVGAGDLMLFADRLAFRENQKSDHDPVQKTVWHTFPLATLTRMIVHGPQTLQFTTRDDVVWEVRSKNKRSAYKYMLTFDLIQQHLKGDNHGFYSI